MIIATEKFRIAIAEFGVDRNGGPAIAKALMREAAEAGYARLRTSPADELAAKTAKQVVHQKKKTGVVGPQVAGNHFSRCTRSLFEPCLGCSVEDLQAITTSERADFHAHDKSATPVPQAISRQ